VVTRVGGNPELVADGERGLVVPPLRPQAMSEAFCTLLADRERGRRMGAEARAFVERELSLERLVRRHDAVYRRVTRGG
jgi:glycosyltransferase involved in cell wall biosynthesis